MRTKKLLRTVVVMALAAVSAAALTGGAITAGAQSGEDSPEITREAYFTRPITEVAPPLVTEGFPPGTICLVAGLVGVPEVCGEEVIGIAELVGITQGLPIPVTPDSHLVQVPPGDLPVGMLGGQERWVSAIRLRLPALSPGEQFTSFELILDQAPLGFALESPAFRALVFSVVAQISEPNPELVAEALTDALAGDVPVFTDSITGIEACPALESWSGGAAQDAALDGSRLPRIDCVRGTTGDFDANEGAWVFDITFAVQAWTGAADDRDTIANEGIFFRPLGAPNLAYGDSDLSTNWLVTLGGASSDNPPRIRYTTGPAAVAITDGPAAAPLDRTPTETTIREVVPQPAPPPPPPLAAGIGPVTARWAELASDLGAGFQLWHLLLIPLVLLGAYLFGQSLLAAPDVVRRRPGALSRMMERRARL